MIAPRPEAHVGSGTVRCVGVPGLGVCGGPSPWGCKTVSTGVVHGGGSWEGIQYLQPGADVAI